MQEKPPLLFVEKPILNGCWMTSWNDKSDKTIVQFEKSGPNRLFQMISAALEKGLKIWKLIRVQGSRVLTLILSDLSDAENRKYWLNYTDGTDVINNCDPWWWADRFFWVFTVAVMYNHI